MAGAARPSRCPGAVGESAASAQLRHWTNRAVSVVYARHIEAHNMEGVLKRVVTAATAATVVTAATAVYFFTNSSHPVPPYDTYHITLSDFALRPPVSGYNGWESTHNHEHSRL